MDPDPDLTPDLTLFSGDFKMQKITFYNFPLGTLSSVLKIFAKILY
jgi:hypothetical protein